MQKIYLRLLPYVISLVVGLVIFAVVDYVTDPNWQNLILNVSAGLISVPFVFICYEFVKTASERKIKRKVRLYVTYHSQKVLLSFIKYFYTWFFPSKTQAVNMNDEAVDRVLNLSVAEIEKNLSEKTLLGFFIYKDISEDVRSLSAIVKNNNLTEYVTDDEMIKVINILRNMTLVRREILDFVVVGRDRSLKIKRYDNPHNFELQLFHKNMRIDSGLFDNVTQVRLLEYFKVPTEDIEVLANQIFDMFSDIKVLMEIMEIDFWNDNYLYEDK